MSAGTGEGAWSPSRGSVYVVDPDPEVGRRLGLLLKSLHFEVEVFETGEGALARILQQPPACLVAEVYLPGLSGIDLLRDLRERGLPLPVLLLATQADVPLAVEAMQLGALDFIEKPVIDRIVLARVREALKATSRERGPEHQGGSAHG